MDWFRIEDGAIVAGSMDRPIPRNEFLCTTSQYRGFELRLRGKLRGGFRRAQAQNYQEPQTPAAKKPPPTSVAGFAGPPPRSRSR